jgi:hypothetical protein
MFTCQPKQRRSSNFESVYVWKNQQLSKRSTEIVQIAEVGSSITDVLGR